MLSSGWLIVKRDEASFWFYLQIATRSRFAPANTGNLLSLGRNIALVEGAICCLGEIEICCAKAEEVKINISAHQSKRLKRYCLKSEWQFASVSRFLGGSSFSLETKTVYTACCPLLSLMFLHSLFMYININHILQCTSTFSRKQITCLLIIWRWWIEVIKGKQILSRNSAVVWSTIMDNPCPANNTRFINHHKSKTL